MFTILTAFAGALIAPIIASYAEDISILIHNRDIADNKKAIEAGEEPLILPEGMELFKNPILSKIIISLINGLLWLGLFLILGFEYYTVITAIASSVLLAISIVDFQVYEIPIECNAVILALGIINLLLDLNNWMIYLIGFGAVSLIFLLVGIITKGKGMGGGDIKLMATLGLLLGWKKIILVMVLGCILGAVIHGLRVLLTKKENVLAFGPYLSAAAYICICYGDEIINWYLNLMMPKL